MSLDFLLSVRSRKFCFFFFFPSRKGERGCVFAVFFAPHSREGNSGLHSTRFNYSSFYCTKKNNTLVRYLTTVLSRQIGYLGTGVLIAAPGWWLLMKPSNEQKRNRRIALTLMSLSERNLPIPFLFGKTFHIPWNMSETWYFYPRYHNF